MLARGREKGGGGPGQPRTAPGTAGLIGAGPAEFSDMKQAIPSDSIHSPGVIRNGLSGPHRGPWQRAKSDIGRAATCCVAAAAIQRRELPFSLFMRDADGDSPAPGGLKILAAVLITEK